MTAAVALPMPGELAQADRRALIKLGAGHFIRRTGGWVAGSGVRISLDVASRLRARNLVRVDTSRMHPQLVLTSTGLMLREILLERKKS